MIGSRLVAAVAAAALALAAAGPALAAPARSGQANIPSPAVVANALSKMLTYADAPRILRIAPGWEYTVKADGSLVQTLCERNGVSIDGPPVSLLFQVELGETDAREDPNSVEQKVWQYRSANQAKRDWRIMVQRAKNCRGRTLEPDGNGGRIVQYLSNGRTSQKVRGTRGLWIWSQMRDGGKSEGPEGGYYVLFLVGDTIQSVEYDYPDAAGLSRTKKDAVDKLAHRLALRWLAP